MFDKIAETAIFLGILIGGYAEPYLVLLAITLSLLVSYARAKSDSLNVKLQGVGIGERAERLLVIAIIGIVGFMGIAVLIVVIIAAITLIQRMIVTAKNIEEELRMIYNNALEQLVMQCMLLEPLILLPGCALLD
jgi:archaetidylinositol phosphate synthase